PFLWRKAALGKNPLPLGSRYCRFLPPIRRLRGAQAPVRSGWGVPHSLPAFAWVWRWRVVFVLALWVFKGGLLTKEMLGRGSCQQQFRIHFHAGNAAVL